MGTAPISLSNAVTSLAQFLARSAAAPSATVDAVRQQAVADDYPYPELAAQVFRFLQTKRLPLAEVTHEDISDAFLSLLLDADAVEALGAGRTQNPWPAVRAALRDTGQALGSSLLELYNSVRTTGLGYVPTLLELAQELQSLFAAFAAAGKNSEPGLRAVGKGQSIDPWKIALGAFWLRRTKGTTPPTDRDLEELFADPKVLAQLDKEQPEGPWEVYRAQGEALRMLRHFGEGLDALAKASER